MRVYTVHENPAFFDDRRIVLVKEGFSWPVLFSTLFIVFTVIWAIYRRVWLGLVVYVIGVVLVGVIEAWVGPSTPAASVLHLSFVLVVAAEANDWRRTSLAGRGYREIGVVIGENLVDAEHRYFSNTASPRPAPPSDVAAEAV